MGKMTESMALYAQPLLDDTDGSHEQMQQALSMAQICWNLALLPENEQRDFRTQMQPMLGMDAAEFTEFCDGVIEPMVKRHHEMFPNMSGAATRKAPSLMHEKKYPGTGRNSPCPCNSEKKYKKCCGMRQSMEA